MNPLTFSSSLSLQKPGVHSTLPVQPTRPAHAADGEEILVELPPPPPPPSCPLFLPFVHIVPRSSEVCTVSPPSRQPGWWNGHLQPVLCFFSSSLLHHDRHSLGPGASTPPPPNPSLLLDVTSRAFPRCGGDASPSRLRSFNCLSPTTTRSTFPSKSPRKSSQCPLPLLQRVPLCWCQGRGFFCLFFPGLKDLTDTSRCRG